jgi:2-oxoglutarate dehydrogenase E2 component (dihydrolipoamide succinyltransferase)
MFEVTVPQVGESVTEVQISRWLVEEGQWVSEGTDLVELETEKASVEVPAPQAGTITKIVMGNEEFAAVGDVIAQMEPGEKPAGGNSQTPQSPANSSKSNAPTTTDKETDKATGSDDTRVMPAAQRLLEENHLSASEVAASGPGGRLLKEDVLNHLANVKSAATSRTTPAVTGSLEVSRPAPPKSPSRPAPSTGMSTMGPVNRSEETKPLSMIRRTIANRLVEAQQTAALLTTFNEVNMKPVMDLRSKYKDAFIKRHGVKLGFMSFFAKASCKALEMFPNVNGQIKDNNIIYRNYADIGIAIGGGKGLVVPILRNVERMGFADIERTIGDFAEKAMSNQLMPEDLEGGTFTISNGGVYGSMLSTPIVNPPQSAILGLHNIQDRPMAVDGEVVICPMMYLALTYDHRIIDGKEAVTFLRVIKETIEDPARLFLEV